MTKTTQENAASWEDAWEEYVAALDERDATYPNRHKPRHVLIHKRNVKRLYLAIEALRKLDADFVARLVVDEFGSAL